MQFWKKTKAKDHWCIYCALDDGVLITAEHLIYDEGTKKITPVCERCYAEMIQPAGFNYDFYLN